MLNARKLLASVDWLLLGSAFFLSLAGLLTMNSFANDVDSDRFFYRQIIWLGVALVVFFVASRIDWRFLRRTGVVATLFVVSCLILLLLFAVAPTKGARSWFDLGFFAFQPVDFIKIILVLLLAKYFSRRHIEIANVRHIIVSGVYSFILFFLIFMQPDFGSAIILFLIWFGMVLVSGISKKHLLVVFLTGLVSFSGLWLFVFKDYQKARITSFIHPLTDLQGAGYNAYQSMIAVGSGQVWGKGVGLGSQSKLKFLPEYETDFIFAAFSEEWGFVGAIILFALFGLLLWRILDISQKGAGNFEILFGLGLAITLLAHTFIHVGMNIGLLPVTGITMPFMSYGGSHLIAEFLSLGILVGMSRYARVTHRANAENEIIGVV